MQKVYKICTADIWQAALSAGELGLITPLDAADGYLHMSTLEQVKGTLGKHFAGQSGLFMLEIDLDALPPALADKIKWEKSTGGSTYPHLYAPLPLDQVVEVYPVYATADGTGHRVPGLIDEGF